LATGQFTKLLASPSSLTHSLTQFSKLTHSLNLSFHEAPALTQPCSVQGTAPPSSLTLSISRQLTDLTRSLKPWTLVVGRCGGTHTLSDFDDHSLTRSLLIQITNLHPEVLPH